MCNTDNRITDAKRQRQAVKMVSEMVERVGQQGTARRLRVNPGIVNWLVKQPDGITSAKELDRIRWTHVTLTPLLYAQIEVAHAVVMYDSELSAEAVEHADKALALMQQLTVEIRAMRKALRNL